MKNTLADAIVGKIRNDDIRMRSRLSVWAEKAGLKSLFVGLLFFLTLIAGLIVLWISLNSDLLISGYGAYGILSFIESFPYIPIIVFTGVFVVMVRILRRYDFSYKKPLLITLSVLMIIVVLSAYLLNKTPQSRSILYGGGQRLRMIGGSGTNFVTGHVKSIDGQIISLETVDNITVPVILSDTTHIPVGSPSAGDLIRSVGVWEGESFQAAGVRVFQDGQNPGPGPGNGPRQGGNGRRWKN